MGSDMFCTRINLNEIEYKEPQSNRNGGKVVNVSTLKGSMEWKDRIRFQMSENESTNLQTAVWGLNTPLPGQDTSRRTLELTIESEDLLKFLNELDESNIKAAVKNSPAWFKKEVDEAAVRQMYVPIVKPPVKADSKPTMRVKVKCNDYPTNIYVVTSDAGDQLSYRRGGPDDLTRNIKCMTMVESVGLWFMSRQFGMSMVATEILVWPNRRATGIDAFTLSNKVSLCKDNTQCTMDTEVPVADEAMEM